MSVPYLDGAACASVDPDFWYPEGARRAEHRKQAERAKEICRYQCQLELVCRELVMAAEAGKPADQRHGVAGGLDPQERAALEGKRLAAARQRALDQAA